MMWFQSGSENCTRLAEDEYPVSELQTALRPERSPMSSAPEPRCVGRRIPFTMTTIVLRAMAVAAVCIAMTQPSVAEDSAAANAPVSILRCDILDEYASPDDTGSRISTDAMVRIAFVNRSSRTIRDVTFGIDSRGGNRTIGDVGQFSSGVLIQHTFGPFGDVDDDARCDVASVTFDDGTLWQRR